MLMMNASTLLFQLQLEFWQLKYDSFKIQTPEINRTHHNSCGWDVEAKKGGVGVVLSTASAPVKRWLPALRKSLLRTEASTSVVFWYLLEPFAPKRNHNTLRYSDTGANRDLRREHVCVRVAYSLSPSLCRSVKAVG